jgi:hypothetical protein
MYLCGENGIKRKLLTYRTPQQNGVVERNNKMIQEAHTGVDGLASAV